MNAIAHFLLLCQPFSDQRCRRYGSYLGLLLFFVACWLLPITNGSFLQPAAALAQSTIPTPTTFTQVTAGRSHSCGLTTSGGVMCWGGNTVGQIGDGTDVDRVTPVNVSG